MTIVVGYVPTDEGRAALRLAVTEALGRESRLVIVSSRHVDDGTTLSEIRAYDRTVDGVRRALEAEISSELEKSLGESHIAELTYEVQTKVPSDSPSEDLINAAVAADADFLVIGLRRRSAVGKLLLGSNAQRVLLEAPCPVIAVHGRPPS